MVFQNRRFLFPAAFLALVAAQGLFVASYVAREHTFYFWDHAMYYNMAQGLAASFRQSWSQGFTLLHLSLAQDYNYLFAIPSLLSFSLFGTTRSVFLLTNFLFFFVLYETAVAFVIRRVYSLDWQAALLLAFAVCSLVPPLWVPLLEGYPDIGAAAFVTLAAGLNVRGNISGRTALITGLLLGLAILLRRHFAYAALALLVSLFLTDFAVILRRQKPSEQLRKVARLVLLCGLSGLIVIVLIGIIAPVFLVNALTIDYGSLYLSYKKPLPFFLTFAFSSFGLFLLVATLAGCALVFRYKSGTQRPIVFLALLTLLWLVIWCVGPSQAGHHYLLQVLPLLPCVGLTGLCLFASRYFSVRLSVGLLLLATALWALFFAKAGVRPNDPGRLALLAAPHPPAQRHDYDELVRLASYLAATTSSDDRIFVLGSSFVFNQDLIRAIYTDGLQRDDVLPRFLQGPEIDSRRLVPLNVFAAATIYVVPEPPQYHLDPSLQKVITAPARQFPPPLSRESLFQADASVFHLEDGVTVRVWRRRAWTPAALHAALHDLRKDLFPFVQPWVLLSGLQQAAFAPGPQNSIDFSAVLDQHASSAELFYDVPLHKGLYRLTLSSVEHKDCPVARFDFVAETDLGQSLAKGYFNLPAEPLPVYWVFSLPDDGSFIRLRFSATSVPFCLVSFVHLSVDAL